MAHFLRADGTRWVSDIEALCIVVLKQRIELQRDSALMRTATLVQVQATRDAPAALNPQSSPSYVGGETQT